MKQALHAPRALEIAEKNHKKYEGIRRTSGLSCNEDTCHINIFLLSDSQWRSE
jgi:hypothetical protein